MLIKYCIIYRVGKNWVSQYSNECLRSNWNNLIEALESLGLVGWELVTEVTHEMSDSGKAYLLKRNL
jgi:hypothetical protein